MEKTYLDVQEVATYLGVRPGTVYRWVHERQIPYYKVGRLLKFKLGEIDTWVNQRRLT